MRRASADRGLQHSSSAGAAWVHGRHGLRGWRNGIWVRQQL